MAFVARAHTDALAAALRAAAPGPALTVYDAEVPATPTVPYVVLYPDGGMWDRSSLDAIPDTVSTTVQLTCVADTRSGAQWVADQAALLLGTRLAVTGRYSWPLIQLGSSPVTRDDTNRTAGNRPLFVTTVDVQLTTTPL